MTKPTKLTISLADIDASEFQRAATDLVVEENKRLAEKVERLRGALEAIAADCPGTASEWHNGTKPCPSCASRSYATSVLLETCNVPMCGESGVCEECRERGAR